MDAEQREMKDALQVESAVEENPGELEIVSDNKHKGGSGQQKGGEVRYCYEWGEGRTAHRCGQEWV